MVDKISEYRRTAQMLRMLANQMRFFDTREQLISVVAGFEKLADRVASRDQGLFPANAA